MATMRPYDYAGGTLYTSTTYPGRKGYAMYYTGYFRQCGWGALFYNNTGKDIIVTSIHMLISANNGSFEAIFSCKDVGTSVPNSSAFSKIGSEFVVTNYGSAITGWTSAAVNENITIVKNHYFIVGVKSTSMSSSNYFNIARTNNNNKKNCYYLENAANDTASGTFIRVTETWKSQTPEIYIDYKDASQPTYINGKQSESLEFWQGDSVSFTLSGYDSTRDITADDFTISRSGSTYTVTSKPVSTDKTATVPINGDNSSSTLYLKSKHPYYNSFNSSVYTLRPGQSATLSETHTGSSSLTYNNFYLPSATHGLTINDNIVKQSSSSFIENDTTTIVSKIKHGNTIVGNGDLDKTLTITSKHWTPQDINLLLNKYQILDNGTDAIEITNKTNLQNVSSDFNTVTIYESSGNLIINNDTPLTSDGYVLEKDDTALISCTTSGSYTLTVKLTNDISVLTTVEINVINTIPFSLIYPIYSNWTVNLRNSTGSLIGSFNANVCYAFKNSSSQINYDLPIYAYDIDDNPLSYANSGYIVPSNYPIKMQFPTLADTDNHFKLSASAYFGEWGNGGSGNGIFRDYTSNIIGSSSLNLNLSGEDETATSEEIRTIILNTQKIIYLDSNFPFTKLENVHPGESLYSRRFSERIVFNYDEYDQNNNLINENEISIILNYDIFRCPDKSSRVGNKIQYQLKNDPEHPDNVTDNSIERVLLDAQRLNYLYGRIQNEPKYTDVSSDGQQIIWAMRSNFFNIDGGSVPVFGSGKLISQSQYLLESLLSGLYDIIDRLKNSPECESAQSLKDKLILPRKYIAHGCPVCWDDNLPESQNLVQNYISDGLSLDTHTASPIMELLNSVSSFQSYVDTVNIVYYNENESEEGDIVYMDAQLTDNNIKYDLYN